MIDEEGQPRGVVLQIADYGSIYGGNFVASLLKLSEYLRSRTKLQCVFVLPSRARRQSWIARIDEQGVPVEFVDERAGVIGRWQRLRRVAARYRPVLLHAHFTRFDIESILTARGSGAQVVLHMHSMLVKGYGLKQRVKDLVKIRGVVNRYADRVVAVSEAVAADARRRGVSHDLVTVIENGIDATRIRRVDSDSRVSMRTALGIDRDAFVALMFGWDPERKGVDVFAAALEHLRSKGGRRVIGLVVAEAKYRNAIEGIIGGGRDLLRIIEPRDEVSELYAVADAFVSASRAEGLPYAVGEAMFAGLPVVVSDIGPVRPYKAAGAGVLSVGVGDVGGLATALGGLAALGSGEVVARGRCNREFIVQSLTTERWCQRLAELYASILSQKALWCSNG